MNSDQIDMKSVNKREKALQREGYCRARLKEHSVMFGKTILSHGGFIVKNGGLSWGLWGLFWGLDMKIHFHPFSFIKAGNVENKEV